MKIFANRVLAGPSATMEPRAPAISIARDVARMVVTAVLAGTAFALLLALTVLSLTVIAPPVQASGAPTVVTFESPSTPDAHGDKSAGQTANAASQMVADATPAKSHEPPTLPAPQLHAVPQESGFTSMLKHASPAVMLLLSVGAGLLAFFAYAVLRRKA